MIKSQDGMPLTLGTIGWVIIQHGDCYQPVRTEINTTNIESGDIWFSFKNCESECERLNKISGCQTSNQLNDIP